MLNRAQTEKTESETSWTNYGRIGEACGQISDEGTDPSKNVADLLAGCIRSVRQAYRLVVPDPNPHLRFNDGFMNFDFRYSGVTSFSYKQVIRMSMREKVKFSRHLSVVYLY